MKKGDGITIVQDTALVLIECLFVAEDYVLAGAYKLLLTDEGVTWLKGYHVPTEACVCAARTCQALREQPQPPPVVPQPAPWPQPPPGSGIPLLPWQGVPMGPSWPNHTLIVSGTDTKGLL